jgi:hypothetical protein
MKRQGLFLLALCAAGMAARGDSIVFDTLGPANTYEQFGAWTIHDAYNGLAEHAAQFTAATGGFLTTVDLAVTASQGLPVNAFLYGDLAGAPDNANQTFLGSVTPTAQYGTTNNTVLSISIVGSVPVVQGTSYWLILKPATFGTYEAWNFSTSAVGQEDFSMDDVNWAPNSTILPAFRLSAAGSPVPDAGSSVRLIAISIVALVVSHSIGRLGVHSRSTRPAGNDCPTT